MPHVTVGRIDAASISTSSSYDASGSDAMLLHHAHARVERVTLRREPAAAQVVERRLIGIHVADARAAFDRHVADRHPLVHRHALDRVAGVFVGVARRRPSRRGAG